MRGFAYRVALVAFIFGCSLRGQELEPGAYSVSPVGVNIIVLSNILNQGDLNFDPSAPIEDARATINASVLGYVRTLNVGGRSANFALVVPYVLGDLEGRALGQFQQITRSGLRDPLMRFAVNLYGAPAMNLRDFAEYKQKTNIGFSLLVSAPLGQYDPNKLINIGQNRWGFKPEIGLSQAIGRWTIEPYIGMWVFTDNNNFYGGKHRKQQVIGSTQLHILYTIRRSMWVAWNSNFYVGGRTTVDDVRNLDLQRNSRFGGTFSMPVTKRSSLKFTYSRGAITTIGGDFNSFAVAYQFLWGAGL